MIGNVMPKKNNSNTPENQPSLSNNDLKAIRMHETDNTIGIHMISNEIVISCCF